MPKVNRLEDLTPEMFTHHGVFRAGLMWTSAEDGPAITHSCFQYETLADVLSVAREYMNELGVLTLAVVTHMGQYRNMRRLFEWKRPDAPRRTHTEEQSDVTTCQYHGVYTGEACEKCVKFIQLKYGVTYSMAVTMSQGGDAAKAATPDVNDLLRALLKGQQGVRHELTKCLRLDSGKWRCPACGATATCEVLCNGIRRKKAVTNA